MLEGLSWQRGDLGAIFLLLHHRMAGIAGALGSAGGTNSLRRDDRSPRQAPFAPFGRVLQRTKSPLHTPTNARRSLDPRYLHPTKHNCNACQGPATGGKDLLLLIVTLFGKREVVPVVS